MVPPSNAMPTRIHGAAAARGASRFALTMFHLPCGGRNARSRLRSSLTMFHALFAFSIFSFHASADCGPTPPNGQPQFPHAAAGDYFDYLSVFGKIVVFACNKSDGCRRCAVIDNDAALGARRLMPCRGCARGRLFRPMQVRLVGRLLGGIDRTWSTASLCDKQRHGQRASAGWRGMQSRLGGPFN